MLKAYVGVASRDGLAILQPESDDTLSHVRRCVRDGRRRFGFWVVIGDTEARCVRALLVAGHRPEALWLLDRSAKDMGRILPSDSADLLH